MASSQVLSHWVSIPASDKGAASGVATLDGSTLLPAAQLPATVSGHLTDTGNPHTVTKAQVGLTNVADLKVNLGGISAPIGTDDSGSGYAIGSRWIDTTGDKEYVCVDASTGTAIWVETSAGGETNTASNVGTGGVNVFKQKSGVDFEFKSINTGGGISVTDDTGNNNVDVGLDVNSLSADAAPHVDNDFVATYDASAGGHKKVALAALPIKSTEVDGGGLSDAITSTTYVVISGMTITPLAGTYLVLFSSSGSSSVAGADTDYAIHVAALLTGRVMNFGYGGGSQTKNFISSLNVHGTVVVNGTQTIDIRLQTSSGTFTVGQRSMTLVRLA